MIRAAGAIERELIDTLWNVNYIAARGSYLFAP